MATCDWPVFKNSFYKSRTDSLNCVTVQNSGHYNTIEFMVGVAQPVELWIVAPVVAGSNPVAHPIFFIRACSSAG